MLTPAQRRSWEAGGAVAVRALVEPVLARAVQDRVEELDLAPGAELDGADPVLGPVSRHPRIVALVAELGGEGSDAPAIRVLDRPPVEPGALVVAIPLTEPLGEGVAVDGDRADPAAVPDRGPVVALRYR